jgi:SAM-dependent methyltransferase
VRKNSSTKKSSNVVRSTTSLLRTAKRLYEREGLKSLFFTTMKFIFALPKDFLWFLYYKIFRSSDTFKFQGVTYHYFYHLIGTTWKTERAVEIPIICESFKKCQYEHKRILEVGNVLYYRFKVNHDILDKYEVIANVINEDVVDFNPATQYDLIISISTLEHVGWDEVPREPDKILRAVENLRTLLAPGGKMIATIPIGENPNVSRLVENGSLRFDKQSYLKRKLNNKWEEASWNDIKDVEYDKSIPAANGLVVGIIERK